jgi:RND family efflux transporter MFP subunit
MLKTLFSAVLCLILLVGTATDLSAAEAAPVAVVSPTRGTEAASYQFTGTVTARQRAQISPRISGLVQTADFEVGDHFEAGQTLLQLDPTLAKIELGLREADVALAETELENAKRLLEEAKKLGDSGFPRSERLTRANNVKQAEVLLSRAQGELRNQTERVRRHKVLAPFPGIIARKLTEVGEWVETGRAVAELVGDDLRLEIRVPQERILEAQNAKGVEVYVQGLPGQTISGSVEALAPVVEPGSRTFLVRIALEDAPSLLKAGMSAVAVFRPGTTNQSLHIPRDAIIRNEAGETLVWTLEESEDGWLARAAPVTLGASRGTETIILSGLSESSKVVVRGNEGLRDGQAVRIVEQAADREPSAN